MTEPALTDPDYGKKAWEDLVDRTNGVDPKRTKMIEEHIQLWRFWLNLMDWEIRYDPTDPNEKEKDRYQAHTHFRYMEKIAQLRIDPKLPDGQVEGSILHELLHLVLRPYTDLAQTFAGRHKQGDLLLDLLRDQEEQLIEALVRAFGPAGFERFKPYGSLTKTWPAFK